MEYKIKMQIRRKISGKYFYFAGGHKSKRIAEREAARMRKIGPGYGVRIIPGTGQLKGYYYLYTTNSAGYRSQKGKR